MQAAVQAWVAAGIFPAFAAGNAGPSCGSLGSPGDYPESFGVAAYDEFNRIADFSSRGPSAFGMGKPNLAAPGVNVRSSVPGDGYEWYSGTSMASPHLAGAIALLWSAAPALIGDIATTRALLEQTAIDTDDTSCGGTPVNNAVWGEGRLDAFAAVDAAPRGPTGYLLGGVSDLESGAPVVGAVLTAHPAEGRDRVASTGADGSFNLRLPVGPYDVTARAFGYLAQTAEGVAVSEGATTTLPVSLPLAPAFALSGVVRDVEGAPVEGAHVALLHTPLATAVTDAAGHYGFPAVPEGDYDVLASAGHCFGDALQAASITAPTPLDFTLALKKDAHGYSCRPAAYTYLEGTQVLATSGDDLSFPVTLPFPFVYYGQRYTSANVSINGFVNFLSASAPYFNTTIPDPYEPNAAIYAAWDDLILDGTGSIRTAVVGTSPNRQFVIEWRDVAVFGTSGVYMNFEIVLSEMGQISLQYATDGTSSSTIGIEDETGTCRR